MPALPRPAAPAIEETTVICFTYAELLAHAALFIVVLLCALALKSILD